MSFEFSDIRYEVAEPGIAWITLNKPDKLNAASWGTWAEMEQAIHSANTDDNVRCVVITGEGRGFCAGTDLTNQTDESQWPQRPYEGRAGRARSRYLATADIYNCTKPTIAAVNGVSVGAGFSLALSCDIRIASDRARFSSIFVKRAITADTGATWFLTRLVGMEQALRLMYTGEMVDAEKALRIGLVSEVVPHDDLIARATELATQIARGPSVAVELMKQLAREAVANPSLEQHIDRETFYQQITQRSEDVAEGRRAFLEKREPVFKGR